MSLPLSLISARRPEVLIQRMQPVAWYDHADTATLFQDAAGTTPTTLNLPIGLRRDKSGRGNHAVQSSAPARPVLNARRNLLEKTEQLDNSYWTKIGDTTVDPNSAQATDGSMSMDRLVVPASPTLNDKAVARMTEVSVGMRVSVSALARRDGHRYAALFGWGNGGGGVVFDLQTGVAQINTAWESASIELIDATFARVKGTVVPVVNGLCYFGLATDISGGRGFVGGETLALGQVQVERGPAVTRYQRVTTATDYDAQGFPLKCDFDTVDDALVTTFAAPLGSNCTIARSIPGVGAQILTAQTIGTTFNDTTDSHGLLIFDRALTAPETAAVTRWCAGRAGL